MSWARIDDEAWFHDKFQQLQAEGAEGMAAIGLWAMALSLTGQKRSPKLTLTQAAMLCGGDRELASRCFVLLHGACLADLPPCFRSLEDSLASKTPSIIIHDWEKYRSKDEAKAAAGRKGGKKSAEKRRAESKQNPSKDEAATKQRPSTPPTPDPAPDPDPDPDPDPPHSGAGLTLADIEQLCSKRYGPYSRVNATTVAALRNLAPFRRWEIDAALDGWPKKWGGLVDFLTELRSESDNSRPKARNLQDSQEPQWVPEYLRHPVE